MTDTATCDVCGAEKPTAVIDRTTVATIAPIEADVCRACQHAQDHTLPDGVCMKCGDAIDSGFALEVAYPLGAAELPAQRAGQLCGDCAGWIACEITYEAIDADEDVLEEHLEILDEERGLA